MLRSPKNRVFRTCTWLPAVSLVQFHGQPHHLSKDFASSSRPQLETLLAKELSRALVKFIRLREWWVFSKEMAWQCSRLRHSLRSNFTLMRYTKVICSQVLRNISWLIGKNWLRVHWLVSLLKRWRTLSICWRLTQLSIWKQVSV